MIIEKTPGTHSEQDEIILVTTTPKEPVTLEDVFSLIGALAKNELKRIRIPYVR